MPPSRQRGWVKKRGSTWTAYWKDPAGRQRTKGGFRTKTAAVAHLDTVVPSVRGGSYVEPSRMTLAEWMLEHWLPAIRDEIEPSTWSSYKKETENHIVPHLGQHVVVEMGKAAVKGWIAELAASGRINGGGSWRPIYKEMRAQLGQSGPGRPKAGQEPAAITEARAKAEAAKRRGGGPLARSSIRYYVVILHRSLKDAMAWGDLGLRQNVTDGFLEQLSAERRPKVVWTRPQMETFLALRRDSGDRLHAAYLTDLHTGLRRGELLGLEWARHVFLDEPVPHLLIEDTLIVVEGKVVPSSPKTDAGYRVVPLDPETVDVLRAHREVQELDRMMAGSDWLEHGLVFCHPNGAPYHPERVSDAFDRAVRQAGVPRIPFKNMRHTHATLALAAGVDLKLVSERLGHASVAITADIYQQPTKKMAYDAALQIGRFMAGERGLA